MIDVRDLRFTYPRAADAALCDISFDVQAGEIFGFLGPSGAGKSTTQKLLVGLLEPGAGEVRVFGRAPRAQGRSLYTRIGVSFETPNLYGRLTGRENLEFFASLYPGRTEDPAALLALVGLDDAADQRTAHYSQGMRMRLNFCRALLPSPELLVLDEPTLGQDPQNARRLKQIIRVRRDAGVTVFLTTHDMTVAAELCDRVAFLVGGRIATVDAPRTLMVRHGQRRIRVELRNGEAIERREFDLDGLGRNDAFLDLLRTREIETLHTLDATLEDVFLVVTGRSLA